MRSIFISYAHKDEALKDELLIHLAPLKRDREISIWHDREIPVGEEFTREISAALERSDTILLLVSPDFLASTYCYDIEVQRALERHVEGTARVIPIILRPSDWKNCLLAALLTAPTDGKPVTTWVNRDEAFLNIITHMRKVMSGQLSTSRIPVLQLTNILRSINQMKIKNNLRQLRSALNQFLLESGFNRANFNDIVGAGKYIHSLPSIAGENYHDLPLDQFTTTWTVTTSDGTLVSSPS